MSETNLWVIKVGSSLVTNQGRGIDRLRLRNWVEQIAYLKEKGLQVILITSGAIAEGVQALGWKERPHNLADLQAAAAVGQMGLAQAYQELFAQKGILTGQVLLTHEDIRERQRYLNVCNTLSALLAHQVVPIVNENDTVTTKEITLGDNDTLGALVSNLVQASHYIILTDQEGLYEEDPRHNPKANLIKHIAAEDPRLSEMAGGAGTAVGTGGMATKVKAARRAAVSGTTTLIVSGAKPDVLLQLLEGEKVGTILKPSAAPLRAKQQWMVNQLQSVGSITVDAGAAQALVDKGKSLLPIGCIAVEGHFKRGDLVAICDKKGEAFAHGLVNYHSSELHLILGCTSESVEERLGFRREEEVVHRNHMVLLKGAESSSS